MEKLTNATFVNLMLPIMLKCFQKNLCDRSWDIRLNNFGSNCVQIVLLLEKRIFLENWLNTTVAVVYLWCPIMLQCLKKILKIRQTMRYKILRFCAKLDTNQLEFFWKIDWHVNFFYFMYPIIILQCLKKSFKLITIYKVA